MPKTVSKGKKNLFSLYTLIVSFKNIVFTCFIYIAKSGCQMAWVELGLSCLWYGYIIYCGLIIYYLWEHSLPVSWTYLFIKRAAIIMKFLLYFLSYGYWTWYLAWSLKHTKSTGRIANSTVLVGLWLFCWFRPLLMLFEFWLGGPNDSWMCFAPVQR